MDKGRTGCESRILAGSSSPGAGRTQGCPGPRGQFSETHSWPGQSQGKGVLRVWGMPEEMSGQSPRPPVGALIRAVRRGWQIWLVSLGAGLSLGMARTDTAKCHLASGPKKI